MKEAFSPVVMRHIFKKKANHKKIQAITNVSKSPY